MNTIDPLHEFLIKENNAKDRLIAELEEERDNLQFECRTLNGQVESLEQDLNEMETDLGAIGRRYQIERQLRAAHERALAALQTRVQLAERIIEYYRNVEGQQRRLPPGFGLRSTNQSEIFPDSDEGSLQESDQWEHSDMEVEHDYTELDEFFED